MKKIKFGSITHQTHGIIVHGCNARGIMGGGLAATIKNTFPRAFEEYYSFIKLTPPEERLGKVVDTLINDDLIICNAITQFDFGRESKVYVNYEAIQKCFIHVFELARMTNLPVHYPLIGAGLANGDWAIISEIIDNIFDQDLEVSRTLWILQ